MKLLISFLKAAPDEAQTGVQDVPGRDVSILCYLQKRTKVVRRSGMGLNFRAIARGSCATELGEPRCRSTSKTYRAKAEFEESRLTQGKGTRAVHLRLLHVAITSYWQEEQKSLIPRLVDAVVESAAKTLGGAVTGGELSDILARLEIRDLSGQSTKWRRIHDVFVERQITDKCANAYGAFIEAVAAPARWSGRRDAYAQFRDNLNETLLLAGLRIGDDGKLNSVAAAKALDESAELANRLRAKLIQRDVHAEVCRFSQRLFIRDGNYFHAVFEATKSLFDRLRALSGSTRDGNELIDEVLERGARPFPLIAFNRYDTPSLQNEQRGVAHLARGLVHAFRNVTGHEPQVKWVISEADALDMMSVASLIHRRLDSATVTTAFQPIKR